ncbi:uncharacterized protein LOC135346585 [Halichondria panicea]|uniref:uncharacterized protein LOC135346585 n=1 Tax=Halichondria panicea TaxID=6063 RepID=UPI00312BB828
MPITFKVNQVEPNKTKLQPADTAAIIKHRCGGVVPEAHSKIARKAVKEMPKYNRPIGIDNGLVSAIHACWSQHYALVLSPDMIWLCIAQGLAQHINQNAEKLRSKLVEHEGKKDLKVIRNDFIKGSDSNPWPEAFEEFSEQIRKHVGDKIHDLLTPSFSTTGPVEKAAAQVVMMDCFKQYFSYGMVCVCGIPEITLEGTADDWKKIREKVLFLKEYDLEWWVEALIPILEQFIAAASGSVDREFWCKIYHQYGGGVYKPGPFVTGWILTFFPYLNGNKRNEFLTLWQEEDPTQTGQVPAVPSPPRGVNADRFKGLAHYQFPPGIASAPFTWQNGIDPSSEVFPMHFYAGFMTISQDSTTMAVRPEIGWAVADDQNYEDAKTRSGRRRW